MSIGQLGKDINSQEIDSVQEPPMFDDSNRTFGMELPFDDKVNEVESSDVKFNPESNRETSEGPQWDESNIDFLDLKPNITDNFSVDETQDQGHGPFVPNNLKDSFETGETNHFSDHNETKDDSGENEGLTDEEKQEIKEKTGWSDEIIDAISSMEEAQIYMDAGLKEVEIDGKKCLIRGDIDLDQVDEDGISNRERMARGRPPITKDGQEVELHHIGQKADSPLAELTTQEHRGAGNDSILHNKNKESEIDRNEFAKERKSHWKSRAEGGD